MHHGITQGTQNNPGVVEVGNSTAQNIGTYLFSDKGFLTKKTEMYNETSSEKNEKRFLAETPRRHAS